MLCSLNIEVLCLACSPAWGPLQWWLEGAAQLEMLEHPPQSSRSGFIPSEDRVLKVFKLKIQVSGCSKNTKLSFVGGSPQILAVERLCLGRAAPPCHHPFALRRAPVGFLQGFYRGRDTELHTVMSLSTLAKPW